MLTLFIPSRYEAADFLRALVGSQKTHVGDTPVFTGKLFGKTLVRVAVCGMGQPHSARRIKAVLAAVAPLGEREPVWLAGFGGGLDPALKHNDIVWLDGGVGAGNAAAIETAASAPIRAAAAATGATTRRIEKIYTSEVVVDTPAKKVAAFQETGAGIVDMETAPFLALLVGHQRAGAVIRVISDDVSEEFPADLIGHSYDFAQGRDTPFRLAWRLATHWGDIARMRRFLAPLPEARRRLLAFVTAAAESIS
jgi:purine-nucleoside phosphorylase